MFAFLSSKDFIAGWVSGICSITIGYPMETVKVLCQTNPNLGIVAHAVHLLKNEGGRGFFKGASYSLWTSGIMNSLYFGLYGNSLRWFENRRGSDNHYRLCCEGPIYRGWHWDCFYAGCLAGAGTAVVAAPIELVKTILQTHTAESSKSEFTATRCLKDLYRKKGIGGFYQGFATLLSRDVPAYGLYAVCYEHLASVLRTSRPKNVYVAMSQEGMAGGCAGALSWAVIYPIDVVKSRLAADLTRARPRYSGFRDCAYETYLESRSKKEVGNIFFRGFQVTVSRAFVVHFLVFICYERSLNILDSSATASAT